MIRQSVTTNRGPGGNHADGGPDPTQNAYWDLDLLTPDDVCALLKVKKAVSTTPWRMAQSRPSD